MEIQLIYASKATRDFSDQELDALLAECVSNNLAKNISGLLLYGGGKFMQVLEGDSVVVESLVKEITKDSRHKNFNLLVKTGISQRDFKQWSMGFRRVDRDCVGNLEHFSAFFEEEFDQNSSCYKPNLALSVMKSFAFPREDF